VWDLSGVEADAEGGAGVGGRISGSSQQLVHGLNRSYLGSRQKHVQGVGGSFLGSRLRAMAPK
jgi:hypothetical protein